MDVIVSEDHVIFDVFVLLAVVGVHQSAGDFVTEGLPRVSLALHKEDIAISTLVVDLFVFGEVVEGFELCGLDGERVNIWRFRFN